MTETLETILEKLKDGLLTIAQAEVQINKLFEDESMRDYYAMAALRVTTMGMYLQVVPLNMTPGSHVGVLYDDA